ncbi:MAG: DUF4339 domain-containing protein [Verrucomicrobiales bacterium]|nr:DUF4339 domain-containing protein [Verrucomicrobiales bacterium]
MNWYYLTESGEVVGPISEETLKELNATGALKVETQICREGTQEWTSLAEVLGAGAPGGTAEADTEDVPAEDLTAHTGPGESGGHPDDGQGASKKPSFSDRLKSEASAGWSDIKRTSREASIHAQIEKLKQVDLRIALFALGKMCYESGRLESDLKEQFQEIRELDATIASKLETTDTEADETKMAAFKRMGKDTAKASHAQALTVKRQHLVTEIGRQAYAKMTEECRPGLQAEIAAIEEVEGNILLKEEEARALGVGHAKGWKRITPGIAVAAALALLLLAGANFGLRMMSSSGDRQSESPSASKSAKTKRKASPSAYSLYMQGYNDPRQGDAAEVLAKRLPDKDMKALAMILLGAEDRRAGLPTRFELDPSLADQE